MASSDQHTGHSLFDFLTSLLRLPRRNLAVRLSLVLGVVALGAALLQSLLAGTVASRQVEADVGTRLSDLNAHVVQLLDRGMFERYREIQLLAALQPLRDPLAPPAERRALLEALQRTYPDYAWVGIADLTGTVVASTGQLLEGTSVAERPWFQGAKEQPFAGDVHEARLLAELLPSPDGEPLRFVDVAVPLQNANGQFIGVLGAHLSWTWAREVRASVITPHETDSQIEAIVVRASGEVLLGPPDVQAQTLALRSVAAAQQGIAGVTTETWPDGTSYLVSYQQSRGYRDYPGLGWIVLVRQPLTEAFAPALALQRQLVVGLLSLAGLLIGLAVLLISRVTRPLRRIAHAADQVRTGGRVRSLPAIPGDDEVARRASSSALVRASSSCSMRCSW